MLKRKLLLFSLIAMILTLSIPVSAQEAPIIYKDTITVTEEGGVYNVGFTTITFKKDFLDKDMLPIDFTVEVYAKNGVGQISFSPDTPEFNKPVHVKVDSYEGLLYDVAVGKNIEVSIPKQQLILDHFSYYAFWR